MARLFAFDINLMQMVKSMYNCNKNKLALPCKVLQTMFCLRDSIVVTQDHMCSIELMLQYKIDTVVQERPCFRIDAKPILQQRREALQATLPHHSELLKVYYYCHCPDFTAKVEVSLADSFGISRAFLQSYIF